MAGQTKNRHYVPEFVLWKFRVPVLYELDIYTGKTTQRNPGTGASGPDLWPQDIEDELSAHDNAAARVYRNILGQQQITLNTDERLALATWFADFYVRSPKRRLHVEQFVEEERQNRELCISNVYQD